MINGFQAINTITSGLILQQLEEDITANNLAQPSVDSEGYLMNSLEQVNSVSNSDITFSGSNGLLSVGTGASASSITRLRSSYLDSQIQQESSVVGYNQVFYGTSGAGVMSDISSILNGSSSTTLSAYLSAFATSWTNLASAPTSAADLSAVVTAGQQFATAANSQYDQLTALQTTLTGQMSTTVTSINQYLQQLANINSQITSSVGANTDSLLDARDYALDYLSQLTNFTATYNSNGTVNLWLGDLSLLDSSGAATLSVNATNYNDTNLTDVTVVSSQGSTTIPDASTEITGGKLGGELEARDVVITNYINDINEYVNSVITMTNDLTVAGYLPNSTTAGSSFFTGTTAGTVAVSSAVAGTPSLYIPTEVNWNSATGQLAGMLGNLPSMLPNSYLSSRGQLSAAAINPTAAVSTQIAGVTGGSFSLNGTTVTYTAGSTIQQILASMNGISGVYAVFNDSTKVFEIYSNTPLTFQGLTGDKFVWAQIESVLTSTMPINNPLASGDPQVDDFDEPMNANYSFNAPPVLGPNSLAYLTPPVNPENGGYVSVNGVQTKWYNTETLTTVMNAVKAATPSISWSFNQNAQKMKLLYYNAGLSASPILVGDVAGNLAGSLWLTDSTTSIQNLSSNMLNNLSTQTTNYQNAATQAENSLTQLNVQQDNLAGVSTTFTGANGQSETAGQSIQTIQQQAYTEMIQFNAMLEVMSIIDQMLGSLVGISSSTSSSGIFAQQTQSS